MKNNNGRYFLAMLHPNLEETNTDDYNGPWLNEKDKHVQIKRFYLDRPNIPLSYNHENTEYYGYINQKDVIGRVLDMYNNEKAELFVKCWLNPDHPYYERIINEKKLWGVSVGVSQPDQGRNQKYLEHVALTLDPGFGPHGSYVKEWTDNEDNLNTIIAHGYLREGTGRTLVSNDFLKRIDRMLMGRRRRRTKIEKFIEYLILFEIQLTHLY